MSKRLVALAVLATALLPFGTVRAATSSTQTCPIVNGIDPDFVTFKGPATIPGDGAKHTVTFFASEEEVQRNLVTLTVVARAIKDNKPATILPALGTSHGLHDTTLRLALTGTPGLTYSLDWIATFDFGPHVCAWFFPGHHAFTVKVS